MEENEKISQIMRKELEKQLHEQYAINNNAHTSSFISFVVALFALFGTLGYVFAFSQPYTYHYYDSFTIDIYLLLSIVVTVALLFLTCICTHIGWSQRRDQIIITSIREDDKLYLSYSNPKDKSRRNFLPDYYNLFYWLFVLSQIGVLILTILKVKTNCQSICCQCYICIAITTLVKQVSAVIVSLLYKYRCIFRKYKNFVHTLSKDSNVTDDNIKTEEAENPKESRN